jgi:hypothetical protein
MKSVARIARDELSAVVVTRDEPTHSAGLLRLARSCTVRNLAVFAGLRRGRSEDLISCVRAVRSQGGMVLSCGPGDELADRDGVTRLSWHEVRQGSNRVREAALVVCRTGRLRVGLLDCDRYAPRARGKVLLDAPKLGPEGVLVVVAGSGGGAIVEEAVVRMKPSLVIVVASRTETAFRGPSALIQALSTTGARVLVTADTGSVRVVPGEGTCVTQRYDGVRWTVFGSEDDGLWSRQPL